METLFFRSGSTVLAFPALLEALTASAVVPSETNLPKFRASTDVLLGVFFSLDITE